MTIELQTTRRWVLLSVTAGYALTLAAHLYGDGGTALDQRLAAALGAHGFTGRIEATLEARLGRRIDHQLADLGRLLWFDTVTGLNNDNNCSGCHSPANGFGDSQSIAIGVENNGIVGPNRSGPRNQRRTPMIVNSAFFPNLMWNSRFASLANDPFDSSAGLSFPPPEGLTLSYLPHLLVAQAFIPPTERVEVAGFVFPGDNFDIRDEVLRRINDIPEYRQRFGRFFPSVRDGGPIDFDMFGFAIAEFEFQLTFADAPIDRFARGHRNALTDPQKQGGLTRKTTSSRASRCASHTCADPSWTPLSPTPNFPDYVSTHSATWGAFSETLRQFFGTKSVDVTLTSVVTGTTRHFTNTDDINREIIDARVYVGFHFRTADVHGVLMGKKIGRLVAKNYFRPLL